VRRVARSGVVVAGVVVALLVVGVAVFAPVVAPHAPDEPNFDLIEAAPGPKAWFGTDRLSRRDLLKIGGATFGALSVGTRAWAQAPKPGGSFISAQTIEATGLDPQLVPAFSRSRRSPMMYNQLVRFDGDMNPVPELAESWPISRDSLTWTFKLRQGVKFHGGQEMTSADVKFTFDRLFEKSPGKSDFVAVDKVEPAGRYAVKFITKQPFAGLLAALGGFWGFIISEAGIKKYGDLNKTALGTGSFMLEDWKVERQMVLKKSPSYFRIGRGLIVF
jgi:peptide/nickel transport system substrate-binding protein